MQCIIVQNTMQIQINLIPDRWTKEFLFKLPRFAYFPFGGGIKSCIGETFAVQEGILALATILEDGSSANRRRYKF